MLIKNSCRFFGLFGRGNIYRYYITLFSCPGVFSYFVIIVKEKLKKACNAIFIIVVSLNVNISLSCRNSHIVFCITLFQQVINGTLSLP